MRLLTLLLAALAICLCSAAASAQVIHGCIKSNGTLKVVDNPEQCGNNETPISWNVQGPPGADGADGQDGMDGSDGSDAEVLRVFDVNGRELGTSWGTDGVSLPGIGIVRANTLSGRVTQAIVWFEDATCTGQAYMQVDFAGFVGIEQSDNRYFVGDTGESQIDVLTGGFYSEDASSGVCVFFNGQITDVIPATEIDPADLGVPWPGPLYVAPAP